MGKRRGDHEGSFRRRGGTWEGAVMLSGRRYYVYAPTRAECRQLVLALVERHRRGSLAPPQRLTLQEFALSWLEGCRQRLRPKTVASYEASLRALLPLLGRLRLDRLTPWHVQDALLRLGAQGRGTRALQLAHGALSACLGEAMRLGLIMANPCQQVPRPRHERQGARDWTLQEMRRFLRAALEDGRPLASMLALILLTGLRPGEAMGLRWDDLDLEAGTLRVRESVTWTGSTWHIGRPKTRAGERTVALPALAVRLLMGLPRESVHLFWSERPPSTKQVSNLMGELCQRAGVPRCPAHYLRHCHASLLAASGLDVKSLQRRLGHTQASITLNVYAHALSEMDRRAAELVDGALG